MGILGNLTNATFRVVRSVHLQILSPIAATNRGSEVVNGVAKLCCKLFGERFGGPRFEQQDESNCSDQQAWGCVKISHKSLKKSRHQLLLSASFVWHVKVSSVNFVWHQ